jgi:phage terminase Nu1 subunit (DNA packaging protein)
MSEIEGFSFVKIKSLDDRVPASTVAALLGISVQGFGDLINKGIGIEHQGRAGYPLRPTLQAAFAHFRKIAAGRSPDTDEAMMLSSARARAANAQAAERELRLGILRGDYVSARAVVHVLGSYVAQCREHLLALPGKWAVLLAHRDAEEIDGILTDEIFECLDDLAAARISADIVAHDGEGRPSHDRTIRNGGIFESEGRGGAYGHGDVGDAGVEFIDARSVATGNVRPPRNDRRDLPDILHRGDGGSTLSHG